MVTAIVVVCSVQLFCLGRKGHGTVWTTSCALCSE